MDIGPQSCLPKIDLATERVNDFAGRLGGPPRVAALPQFPTGSGPLSEARQFTSCGVVKVAQGSRGRVRGGHNCRLGSRGDRRRRTGTRGPAGCGACPRVASSRSCSTLRASGCRAAGRTRAWARSAKSGLDSGEAPAATSWSNLYARAWDTNRSQGVAVFVVTPWSRALVRISIVRLRAGVFLAPVIVRPATGAWKSRDIDVLRPRPVTSDRVVYGCWEACRCRSSDAHRVILRVISHTARMSGW
jgi:hypothetical protein